MAIDYRQRRKTLRESFAGRDILILSATNVPRNYAANVYPFHQDATFRYYTGLNIPDAAIILSADGRETLFVTKPDADDYIWTGAVDSPDVLAARSGIENVGDYETIERSFDARMAWFTPYDAHLRERLARWLGVSAQAVCDHDEPELCRAIANQRLVKSAEEIAEMESAIALTKEMLAMAQTEMVAGRLESDVLAALLRPAIAAERAQSFEPIVTTHGETLHSTSYRNVLKSQDILLVDCGAESELGYCADITRTFSIGAWDSAKREIYDVVLKMQLAGIAKAGEKGASQYDVHMAACRVLTEDLQALGLMKGDVEESLRAGAHALFMPHGIGHALGLDAHDMENFGDVVGYENGARRSTQFGLNALRFARQLKPGYVVTVEPGCYFIPALIEKWRSEHHLEQFICYEKVAKYNDMRGIRIEDDVVITDDGCRVLGPGIEK